MCYRLAWRQQVGIDFRSFQAVLFGWPCLYYYSCWLVLSTNLTEFIACSNNRVLSLYGDMVKSLCPSYHHWFCLNFPSLEHIVKFQSNVLTFDTVIEGIHSTDISSVCWMFPVAMMWTLVFWGTLRSYSIMVTVTFCWSPLCHYWIYSALCLGDCRLDFQSGPCHCVGTLDQMPPGSF